MVVTYFKIMLDHPNFKFLICVWSPILPLSVIAAELMYMMYFYGLSGVHILCESISSV